MERTPESAPAGTPEPEPRGGGSALSSFAFLVLTVAVLYFGRDFLIPLALAILLSFVLGPLVIGLRRWGLPRVPAVLLVVVFAFSLLGALGTLLGSQFSQLVQDLPTYQQNVQTKIRSLQADSAGGGTLDRAGEVVRELRQELEGEQAEPNEPEVPVVRLEQAPPTALEVLKSVAGPLLGPVGKAGLVVVYVIFMLLEREELRNRLIRLVGGDLYLTTEVMDEAAHRVSRYLLMQLVVNTTYGVPLALGLYLIGVPNALLWGALAVLLRFIPYVGPVIGASFPLALAVAVDPGWSMLFWTAGLILTMELISNNFIEPWLYGSSTGISAVAIIIAAVFWTTLWGPVGLFLSTPLTVCLAVLGRYVPPLRFLDVLLGSAPALAPAERFYQRMLAGDPDEDVRIAEEYLKEQPLSVFYDEVALPALRLAEQDRQRGSLNAERRAQVSESIRRVVAELADHEAADEQGEEATLHWVGRPVLCAGGRSSLDQAAAAMLAQLLERRGVPTRVVPPEALSPDGIASLEGQSFELIAIAFLGNASVVQARQTCRRLRRRLPDASILAGLWNGEVEEERIGDPKLALGADLIATSLGQAVERILLQAPAPEERYVPPPVPPDEAARLQDLRELRQLDTPREERFDRYTRRLAEAFGAPIALLTLIDESRQYWKAESGLPEDLAEAREGSRELSMCGHAVASNDVLVVEDVLKDRRFANNPFLRERGIRFYAGAPLRSAAGRAVGTLCVLDTVPRRVSATEKAMLQVLADEVMRELARDSGNQVGEGR